MKDPRLLYSFVDCSLVARHLIAELSKRCHRINRKHSPHEETRLVVNLKGISLLLATVPAHGRDVQHTGAELDEGSPVVVFRNSPSPPENRPQHRDQFCTVEDKKRKRAREGRDTNEQDRRGRAKALQLQEGDASTQTSKQK